MKNLTKTVTAVTLALSTVSVNAAILEDNSLNAEAWMSVYDLTSKQTFTLDLGGAKIGDTQGITVQSLIDHKDSTGSLVNVDLTQYSHWNEFKNHPDFNASTTIYLVATAGINQATYSPNVLITGTDNNFFETRADFTALGLVSQTLNTHVLNINTDTPGRDFKNFPANVTTLVIDGDDHIGQHTERSGSTELWGGATYNPNGLYGQEIPFQFANVDSVTYAAQQMEFAAKWKLDGDTLTLASSVSQVPVPAAVWMFGSAMLGLIGVKRKRKMA